MEEHCYKIQTTSYPGILAKEKKQKILKPILENFTKPSDLSSVNKKQTTGTCMVTCIRETIGFEIKENVTPQGPESRLLRSANVEYRHILPCV